MGLQTGWIDFLYKAATGTRRMRTLLTPIGAIIFLLFTALFVVVALCLDSLLGLPKLISTPWSLIISTPLIMVGVLITAWSGFHFLRVKGTPVPFNPPPRLVVTGPYAYARNPMLSGIFLLLFGIGIAYGSVSLVFIFTPLFILINAWELKAIEEPELVKRLGEEYQMGKSTPSIKKRL